MRDRSFENQGYLASGLNLITAAVVLWNTVYLGRAIQAIKDHGETVDENLLQGQSGPFREFCTLRPKATDRASCHTYGKMCLAVYIGTDERIEDRSGRLHIEAAVHEPDSLMRQVVPGIVYFVATREGCGCKFRSRSRKDRAPLAVMVSELARRAPGTRLHLLGRRTGQGPSRNEARLS